MGCSKTRHAVNLTRTPWAAAPSLPIPDTTYPKKEPMSPPRIRHCRLPHPQSTPEQTREKTPLIRSRAKLRLSMLIKPSFHQRSRNTTRLCAPCSAPSATKSARRSVPRADVATVWAEGNRSLTPVRVPSHRYVHHPPPWRRVAHLPSDFTQEPLFFSCAGLKRAPRRWHAPARSPASCTSRPPGNR